MSFTKSSENIRRKTDHVHAALHEDVEFHMRTAGFERYTFVHEALPEINRSEIDTSTRFLGRKLSMPFMISPMTGGAAEVAHFNRLFAEAAQHFGIAMGVGSQRVAIENPDLEETYRVRDIAPDILLFANLGAVQLNNGCDVDCCAKAVEMIRADALMLHLNPLQEAVQYEGNTNFRNLAMRIGDVVASLDVPVIIKEVGHGISARTAAMLADAGVDAIDVAGAGGTSWAKVESFRSPNIELAQLGESLGEWGIPTVDSLLAVREVAPSLPLIASGGVRSGEDIAKSIALGADIAAMALPLLKCAAQSRETLYARIEHLRQELITVMFCTASKTIPELRHRHTLSKLHP